MSEENNEDIHDQIRATLAGAVVGGIVGTSSTLLCSLLANAPLNAKIIGSGCLMGAYLFSTFWGGLLHGHSHQNEPVGIYIALCFFPFYLGHALAGGVRHIDCCDDAHPPGTEPLLPA